MFDGGHAPLSKSSSKPSSHPAFLALVGRAVSNAGHAAARAPRSVATPHAARSYSPVGREGAGATFAQRVGHFASGAGHAVGNAIAGRAPVHVVAPNVASSRGRTMLVQALMREFSAAQAQGLLPAHARLPGITFDTQSRGRVAMYADKGQIHALPGYSSLTSNESATNSFIKQTLMHETAHTMQSPATLSSRPAREGGAQAWSDLVGPKVIHPYYGTGDGGYAEYVGQVGAREGLPWIQHGQFQNVPLPPINAPNTQAGQNAVRGVGASAANAIEFMGRALRLRELERQQMNGKG